MSLQVRLQPTSTTFTTRVQLGVRVVMVELRHDLVRGRGEPGAAHLARLQPSRR